MNIYCAYDNLNPPVDKTTGKEIHACKYYNTIYCSNCGHKYNGEKVKKYMENNPKELKQ